jgi:hypothetical protein
MEVKDRFDDECEVVTREKNEVHVRMLQRSSTRRLTEEYRNKRRKKKSIEGTNAHMKNQCIKDTEELRNENESGKLYKPVNTEWKAFKPRVTMCKDMDGNIITGKIKILDRWVECFDELLNRNVCTHEHSPTEDYTEEVDENYKPTQNEIEESIGKLTNNKAPGIDSIQAELLKHGSKELIEILQEFLGLIWINENMPDEWKIGIMCPLHKKGDPMQCASYRGITLLNTTCKVFSKILYTQLLPYAEKVIGNYQCGF